MEQNESALVVKNEEEDEALEAPTSDVNPSCQEVTSQTDDMATISDVNTSCPEMTSLTDDMLIEQNDARAEKQEVMNTGNEPAETGTSIHCEKSYLDLLEENWERCLHEIQSDSVLQDMFKSGEVTPKEYEEISRVPMKPERNSKLLELVKTGNEERFHAFCRALRSTDQLILAQAFGAIGPLRIKIKLTSPVKQEGLRLMALGLLNDKARNTSVLRCGDSEVRCASVQTVDLETILLTCHCRDVKCLDELRIMYEDGTLARTFKDWSGLVEDGGHDSEVTPRVKVTVDIGPKEFQAVTEELKILQEAETERQRQSAYIWRWRERKEDGSEISHRGYADVVIQMETSDLTEEALREKFASAGLFIPSDNPTTGGVLVLPENVTVNAEGVPHFAEVALSVVGVPWSAVTVQQLKTELQSLIAAKVLQKNQDDTEMEIISLNMKTLWGDEEEMILKDTTDHNSEDAENVRIKLLQIFLPTLVAFLPLEEFVNKIRSLTSADKESVLFHQRRSGKSHAVTVLMETLILRPCWYTDFLYTLENMDTDDGKFILSVLAACQDIPTQSMVKLLKKSDELLEIMRMAMTMGDEGILKDAYEVVREGAKTAKGLYLLLTGAALGVGAGFVAAGLAGSFHGAVGGPVGMIIGGTLGLAAGAFYHFGNKGSPGSCAGATARVDFTQVFCRAQDSGFDTKKFMENRTKIAKQIQRRQHDKLKKEFKMMQQQTRKESAIDDAEKEGGDEQDSQLENDSRQTEEKSFWQRLLDG